MVKFLLLAAISAMGQKPAPTIDYYKLSPSDFFALAEVHQTIDADALDRELLEAAVFFASVEIRKNEEAFQYGPLLSKSARFHAEYLESIGTLEHLNRNNKKYRTPMMRADAFGANYIATAENLARLSLLNLENNGRYYVNEQGQYVSEKGEPISFHTYASLARKVVDGWMHSKGHRKNLKGDYNYLGCGVSRVVSISDGVPEVYFNQNFGKK